MARKRARKPTRKLYTYDRKTGRRRRINQKLSRAIRRSPKFRKRRNRKMKAVTRMKISRSLKRTRRMRRTKFGRRTKWSKTRRRVSRKK